MADYIITCDEETASWVGNDVDAMRRLVRCRDCIYYKPDPDPIDPGWPMMCERTGDDMVEPYGFCAWAQRKEMDE